MIKPTTHPWNGVVTVISVLIVAESATFVLAALWHAGIPVPLGFSQPVIIPAAIVGGLCGLVLALMLYSAAKPGPGEHLSPPTFLLWRESFWGYWRRFVARQAASRISSIIASSWGCSSSPWFCW